MIVQSLAFYLFAAILVASAVMVITARNPVHSVLFLILAFFNAAGLFVLIGAEFVAMILVIVYVGAVAVLFLFVVMMLDINFRELRAERFNICRSASRWGWSCWWNWRWCSGTWARIAGSRRRRRGPTPIPDAGHQHPRAGYC